MKSLNSSRKQVPIIMAIVGMLLLFLSTFYIIKQSIYMNKGTEVKAIIVDIISRPGSGYEDDAYENALKVYDELLSYYRKMGIISQNTTSAIIITYNVDGHEYIDDLGYFSNNYYYYQEISIFLFPDKPEIFFVKNADLFAIWTSLIIGSVLFCLGALIIIVNWHNNRAIKYLRQEGKKIIATILYVDESNRVGRFNKRPFMVTCKYEDQETKEEIFYTSDQIYARNNPHTYIGRNVEIFLDPQNEKIYYVDVTLFEVE